jgi:hypothetical protein
MTEEEQLQFAIHESQAEGEQPDADQTVILCLVLLTEQFFALEGTVGSGTQGSTGCDDAATRWLGYFD